MKCKTNKVPVAAAISLLAAAGAASKLVERQNTNTNSGGGNLFSGQFCDYTSFQASVVGGRLLMFGGNLTVNRGSNANQKRELEPGFQFFSIMLNETFSTAENTSTYLRREPDPSADKRVASIRDGGAFSYNGEIYFYGGEQLFNAADGNTIFKCTPTSENIVWNQVTVDGVSRAVTRGAPVVATTENKGFYFGGQDIVPRGADDSQADLVLGNTYLNNLVSISFAPGKQSYTNITASPTRAKPLAQSNLLFVPAGKEGILLNLGGDDGSGNGAWETLQVFDIASSTWYNQQTRGNLTSGRSPNPGSGTCSVIISSGNTHYVYVYGGSNRAPGQSQLAILTIPSFTWSIVSNENFPSKVDAQCQLVGTRQMLILGGRSSNNRNDCGNNNFLEILDLSSLEIVTNFPDSSPFNPPTVRTLSNSTQPAGGWTDPGLRGVYDTQYQTAAERSSGGKSDRVAIIGGVVGGVGGVLVIAIIAIFFIMRSNRRKSARDVKEAVAEVKRSSAFAQPFLPQTSPGYPSPGFQQGVLSHDPAFSESYKDELFEAPANPAPSELPTTQAKRPTELP
ncbi:hypothetical protein DRE_07196 [Drechslerella stenobrocha 248]|uniref:Uncharacterized protein n=1 Tax=Drechslerella stenobrocha 248 TaxID=1043628 RepID=W7HM19_9PEZI|nr:hypothetical protein DRE_07196 [Drechslerella stenobrocha 248]